MKQQIEDLAAVRDVIHLYIRGSEGDVELLRSIFHPDALMSGYFQGHLGMGSPEPFFEEVAGMDSSQNDSAYRAEVESIDVTGNVATAKLVETGFLGTNFIDFFHLIRIDADWKIISKTYHQED